MIESYYVSGEGWHGPVQPPRLAVTPPPVTTSSTTTVTTTVAVPVTTVPTPVPVPTPSPAKPHHQRRLRVKVLIKWTWNHGATRLREVKVGRLPGSGRVTVSCQGRGCPRGRYSAPRGRRVVAMFKRLGRRVYRPGDRIRIVITARGWAPEYAEVDIHNSAEPTAKLLRH